MRFHFFLSSRAERSGVEGPLRRDSSTEFIPCHDTGLGMTKRAVPRGLTLLEVVIGLALVEALVLTFGVSIIAASYAQKVQFRNMASALADEELAALKTMSSSSVAQQANGPLLGVLFAQGAWQTVADGTAPSQPNALETTPATTTGVTSVLPLPNGAYGDFTLQSSFKALTGAPPGWQIGFLFRAADLQNNYQLYLTANSLALMKDVNGALTTIYSDSRSVAVNSWQTLQVVTSGSSISVYLNGLLVTSQTDTTFTSGKAALAVWQGASAHFDNVTVGGVTEGFDATALGQIPDAWLTFGLSNLPMGTGTLTVTQPYGDTKVKNYATTIFWSDRNGIQSVSESAIATR